jgi:hypothetical protein
MKLISPWRYSTTSLERCLATKEKPIFSNKGSSRPAAGRRKLYELETAQTHWVVKQISHVYLQKLKKRLTENSEAFVWRRADAPASAAGEVNTDDECLWLHG